MIAAERIQNLTQRVELLAPAGHWQALQSILDAGADAVYLSAKQFNMRMHRSDFHFTLAQLADAVKLVHDAGRRIYVTVNALLGERELEAARDLLRQVAELGVDAVIVQDLGAIRIVQQAVPALALHASTMMNVHHPEQASVLKSLGVTRVIASRDISLAQMNEISRLADVEIECFVHGDMCVAQSGQCDMSGILFGKSANRGQCMKPCRWSYELIRLDEDEVIGPVGEGHLLAIKDLCLIRQLPDLIQAGVVSLKIEGRMRDADYLRLLVCCYRQAIDAYYTCPPTFSLQSDVFERLYRHRVRALSTLTLTGNCSQRSLFDSTGRQEPLFLSDGCIESGLDEDIAAVRGVPESPSTSSQSVELVVSVADPDAARAAVEAGADRVDLAAEHSQLQKGGWSVEALRQVFNLARSSRVAVGIRTPRITTAREWAETRWLLQQAALSSPDVILVHHPGTLSLARKLCPDASLIADYGFNVLNSAAIALLAELGAKAATLSIEAGLMDLHAVCRNATLPLELFAHGPLPGMLMDHCLLAMYATQDGRKDVCHGPCRHVAVGLRDRCGQVRPVIADQHCRNHLLTAHDLAILPVLDRFLLPAVTSIRIEGQFYDATHVRTVTRAYRCRLDSLSAGGASGAEWHCGWQDVLEHSPRPLNLGAYARSITAPRSAAAVMQELARR